MNGRCFTLAVGLLGCLGLLAADPAAQVPPAGDPWFGLTRVWPLHLEIAAAEFEAMQPATPAFPGPGGPPQPPRRDGRPVERNLFGTAFPWAQAAVAADGQTLARVGIRYGGDATYLAAGRGLKRPLKLQFDRFGGPPFHGMTAAHLHAMPLDPAKCREALALAVFRAAGVPAPRTAFAEVTLTVPGKYDKEYLGLFTVVEDVGRPFLAEHFGSDKALLLKPARMRGLDYLGADWERYRANYQPLAEPGQEQAQRLIAFAKLVNQAGDEDFRRQIDGFLDVDRFLRFVAANALVANLESFLALGHNYYLALDPRSNQFVFLPADLEFAFANFLLLGTADQLMDLSILHPYPGENKVADRLLAIPEVKAKYLQLVKTLAATVAAPERLVEDAAAVEKATREVREKEARAVAARREPSPGFGPPGANAPQPPDLKAFAARRAAAVAEQLAGRRPGFVPQPFGFGPPPGGPQARGGANNRPVDELTLRTVVQAPPEFDVTLFAAPPKVSYPVAVAAGPPGVVYVASDEQGSLGRTPGGGRIYRCVDRDGDGKADAVTVFAKVEHPRGVIYRDGAVWVMHPPSLSVFHDDDGDGVADRQEVLVTGLTTDLITTRGGDHTTNGIRMGVDGWIYVGVGDYGIQEAKGKDGRTIVLRGGGVVRVRPDGTELEIYCTGLRNPFDLAVDPFLNLFTRDNTNDGGGWDTRVSHLMQTAHYGYTQLFANFTDEIMPTLGVFGGGGGTGGLYVQDPRWPGKYGDTLYTGDWGRSEVYRHDLKPHGPTFDLQQEVFLKLPRATGMDVAADGRLYVASWRGGEASVYVGPNVGFVACVTPKGLKPAPFPDLKAADLAQLLGHLAAPQAVLRWHAQGELLRRGRGAATSQALEALAADVNQSLEARVIALFTLKQLDGLEAQPALLRLAKDAAIRDFALRALTDRLGDLAGLDPQPFVAALADPAPRVRAQAVISLGRMKATAAARHLLPLTQRPTGSVMPTQTPVQNQPDPDRVIPHLAVRALVAMRATDACLEAIDGPHWPGALWALRYVHQPEAVEGLIKKLGTPRPPEVRRALLATLIRLYHREADYAGTWWGIRPDSTGPYYDRIEWASSRRIGEVLTTAILDADPATAAFLKAELARHQVRLAGVPTGPDVAAAAEKETPIVIPKADANDPNQIGALGYEATVRRALRAKGDPARGKLLFKAQACATCHTDADGQTPKGPHLVDIGKRYQAEELLESVLKPSAKIAQGYETYLFALTDGRVLTGFVVSEGAATVRIREATGVQRELRRDQIEARQQQKQSAMPEGLVNNLKPEQLADLIAYLQSLK